ncbi:MAG: lipid-A-disaccharide synthase, partial [Mucilaginibacter polytrichastri]|nr:lipid-A-disaccharide synthase [Mucilaginibacter polytrichastri]
CILPFEVDFYARFGMQVDYIGNPLLDEISAFRADADFATKNPATKPVIALLPGSRKQEIEKLLPVMLEVVPDFPDHQFIIAGAPSFSPEYYNRFTTDVPVLFDQTYNLLSHAKAAVVTSGTATLETALFNVPEVVIYKAHPLFIWIGRLVVKIKFISLVNLIAGKKVVEELIQEDCNRNRIGEELKKLMTNEGSAEMESDYRELHKLMGAQGASARAAAIIFETAKKVS